MTEPGGQPRNIEELDNARQVVAEVLRDANASMLFGSPIDPIALPDYGDVISDPKDLGTILADIQRSIDGEGPYKTSEDVFSDASIVWSNCTRYNNRPEEKSIRAACKKVAKLFERVWRQAGLSLPAKKGSPSLKATPGGATPGGAADTPSAAKGKAVCSAH